MSRRPRVRFATAYDFAARILLGVLLAFAAANAVAALLLATGVGVPAPGALRYGMDRLRPLYPDLSDEEVRDLVTEMWTRPYVYEPYTQFREEAFTGRYLNILPAGFRSSGRPQPWPPDPRRRNVFLFGGSTAFGYGVTDEDSLPAQLEAELAASACGDPVTIYNLARSNYFSSQERIHFEQLLASGTRPALAIFVDGLNEFGHPRDEPKFSARLSYLMRETHSQLIRRWLVNVPLARWIKTLREEPAAPEDGGDPDELASLILERWFRNKQLIEAVAEEFDVDTLFVWQPTPLYGFDRDREFIELTNFATPAGGAALVSGYSLLEERWHEGDPRLAAPGFLWLADAHAEGGDPLYVDRVHYSPGFNLHLAERLAPAVADLLCDAGTSRASGEEGAR